MLAHISYIHTETALSLVYQKPSCLENSLYLPVLVIEIMESHEVAEQSVKVAIHMQELIYHIYITCLFSKCRILSYKLEQCCLLVLSKKSLYCIQSQSLHTSPCLRSLPCRVSRELRTDSCPILLLEDLLLRTNYRDQS